MFTKEDILKKMYGGASIEDIAAEITDILNAANDEYVAKQAVSAKRAKKAEIAKQFNELIKEYIEIEHPDLVDLLVADDEDYNTMVAMLDDMIGALKFVSTFKDFTVKPDTTATKANLSDDDILSNFISKICQ